MSDQTPDLDHQTSCMRYYVFTFDGYGLPIAYHLQQEGHEVIVAQVEDQDQVVSDLEKGVPPEVPEAKKRRLSLYDGLLDKRSADMVLKDMRKREDALAFFDLNHLYRYAERVRELGYVGNYPTEADYLLEIDRERAKGFVCENYPQMRVGENHKFRKAKEAKGFLEGSDEIWVLKGLEEDARTVVPDVDDVELAAAQILNALEMERESYESAGFLLEKKITPAMEFTPERVYLDGHLLFTTMVIENKEIGAGNVGPQTDCSQDLAFLIDNDSKIAQIAFPPIVDEMAKAHPGLFFWDASVYLDSRGRPYFGEFCSNRPGYNSLYNQLSLIGSTAKYFECAMEGTCPYPEDQVGVTVRMFNMHEDGDGRPLRGAGIDFRPEIEGDLWLVDTIRPKRRHLTAGYKDTIGVAAGRGHSVSEAARRAYRAVDGLSFEGLYYRPNFDLTSREYRTSIVNRIEFGLERGLYKVGFGLS